MSIQISYFFTEFIEKLTFPIMAYLVEGFHYTRNIKKYETRSAFFWIISIYPFHMLFYPDHPFSTTELVNNIFFTLLYEQELVFGIVETIPLSLLYNSLHGLM